MDLSQYAAVRVAASSLSAFSAIPLVSSKSESNRALIIQALRGEGIELQNLSEARDTQTMQRLLQSESDIWDVLDAGTTMRFLTAFAATSSKRVTLTGTPRMKERPLKILVDALTELGARIRYQEKEGYPPIAIEGEFEQVQSEVAIKGDVSSQYISALLMVAPNLSQGLALHLIPPVNSRPYIKMTLQLMQQFGIQAEWSENTISVTPQSYREGSYTIESDWSGASYWYSIVALSKNTSVKLLNLRENSLQGDKAMVEIMEQLGVKSTFEADGVLLEKQPFSKEFTYDFTHCPDLAQTVAVICAANQVQAKMTGLQSLRIKETDRIAALENELGKLGCPAQSIGDEVLEIPASGLNINGQTVETYEDHRMAMAFAPLAIVSPLTIEEPLVVEKSYPRFWEHLQQIGFQLEFVEK